MHLLLRWGGGGANMAKVKGQKSGHLIPPDVTVCRPSVTSHLIEATPGDQTGR